MAQKINFTKSIIEAISPPEKGDGRLIYKDTKIDGLELRVGGSGRKVFSVYKSINSLPIRITIGKFPDMTPARARQQAQKELALIAEGINPNEKRREGQASKITLREAFLFMLEIRTYKKGTIIDYTKGMNNAFSDWMDKPLKNITRSKVLKRHLELSKKAPTRANNSMRVLRAVFNFAKGAYEDKNDRSLFPDNPVIKLNNLRAWNPSKRKQTIIQRHQLEPWFKAVQKHDEFLYDLQESTTRDYIIFILLTGLRREEAATLAWENVDLKGQSIVIKDTKNGSDFRIPLSRYILEILKRRFILCGEKKYVFVGKGKTGHIISPSRFITRVRKESGVTFTIHDLRRTFSTIAESLDISTITLKRLVNHRLDNADVTAGYVIHDVERLREPMQKITDFILEQAKVN